MKRKIYLSKIDWWLIALIIFACVVAIIPAITEPWWFAAIYGVCIIGTICIPMFGCWYAIEGSDFIVYQFFRPHRFPIHKIKEVKFCKGILAGAALSTTRIAIRFTDRKILKSSMPIEISPKDREGFVHDLTVINPDITVIR